MKKKKYKKVIFLGFLETCASAWYRDQEDGAAPISGVPIQYLSPTVGIPEQLMEIILKS